MADCRVQVPGGLTPGGGLSGVLLSTAQLRDRLGQDGEPRHQRRHDQRVAAGRRHTQ
jgi:hypothetical protein